MIEFNAFWIICVSVIIVTFVGLTVIAKLSVNPIDSETFSFKRVFPFEVINKIDKKGFSSYKVILFIFVFSSLMPLILLTNNLGFYKNLLYILLILGFSFVLSGVCFLLLHFFNPSNVKEHLALVVIFSTLTFLSGLLVMVFSYNLYYINTRQGNNSIINLIFGCIALALALSEFVSVFTFKLKDWAKLDKIDDATLKRPAFFPLAAYEWLTILILVLEELCFFLTILKY